MGARPVTGRVTRRRDVPWSGRCGCGGDDQRGFGQVQGLEDVLVAGGELGAVGEGAVVAGEGAQVDALEFGAQVVPGLAGGGLGDADQQQGQPAQGDVGADPVFQVVADGPQVDDLLHVTPAAFDFQQLLVAQRDVLGGDPGVAAAQQELAVQPLLGPDPGGVDAQQPAGGGLEEFLQAVFGRDDAAEPGPVGGAERVGALDHAGELGDELAADGGVTGSGFRVVADHHPVTGIVDPDLFDVHVPGDLPVAALP